MSEEEASEELHDVDEDQSSLHARLVYSPDDPEVLTYVRHVDARSALSLALKQYLQSAQITWYDGVTYKFAKVFSTWAEPEDQREFPALAIVGVAPAKYDADRMGKSQIHRVESQKMYVKVSSEVVQEFELWLWTNSPNERAALVSLLEDLLEPVDWMTGVRLELPFYFNTRATYEKLDIVHDDNEANAQRRERKARISVTGSMSQIVPLGKLPYFVPKLDIRVEMAEPTS